MGRGKSEGRVRFDEGRKAVFLDEFSVTGSIGTAAAAAGVDLSTAYRHRRSDQAFRLAWAAAQEDGYVSLEAELLRRARELLDGRAASAEAQERLQGMDSKLAFALLQGFHKGQAREADEGPPQRSDLGEATKRLEQVMAAMKLLPGDAPGDNAGSEGGRE